MEGLEDVPGPTGVDAPILGSRELPAPVVEDDEFREAYGEPLAKTLDLGTWRPGEDLAALYEQLAAQVEDAVAQEEPLRDAIRAEVFPRLSRRPGAPLAAGVYQARPADIERVHRGLLFNGAVEACDGTRVTHDTLAVTIAQIGVCLVTYRGDSGSWVHRLFRRDLRHATADPAEEALALIERRQRRSGIDQPDRAALLSDLLQRGIMAYAERAVLLAQSDAPWRMGHGNPAPYELLTGSGSMELLTAGLGVLDRLIDGHRKFVFVPSAPAERGLLTIGHALRPLEYAVVDTMTDRMKDIVDRGHYAARYKREAGEFVAGTGPWVVVGIFRA